MAKVTKKSPQFVNKISVNLVYEHAPGCVMGKYETGGWRKPRVVWIEKNAIPLGLPRWPSFIFFALVNQHFALIRSIFHTLPVADPDLELRGGGGGAVLIYLPCPPFSLQSFLLFLPKIRGGPGPPGPSPRSATGTYDLRFKAACIQYFNLHTVNFFIHHSNL